MAKNYLLIDFGNTNIKCTIYSEIYDRMLDVFICPNKTSARELLQGYYSIRGNNIDVIVECVTTSPTVYQKFNDELAQLLPNAQWKILNTTDFAEGLKENGFFDVASIKDAISPDILLASFWLRNHQPNGCLINFGAFYFALSIKEGKFKNLYLLPSISRGLDLIADNTSVHQDKIPKAFHNAIGLTTTDAISLGGATMMEGFIDKVLKDANLEPKDVILTGLDVNRYPDLLNKYKLNKDFFFESMIDFIKTMLNK